MYISFSFLNVFARTVRARVSTRDPPRRVQIRAGQRRWTEENKNDKEKEPLAETERLTQPVERITH